MSSPGGFPPSGETRPLRLDRGLVGSVAARSDGETYELAWIFDVRFLADEPYHGLTPLQRSKHCPCACEEAPASLNGLLKKLAS